MVDKRLSHMMTLTNSDVNAMQTQGDCNLSDNEEEKTQTHAKSQKKALLSIDNILKKIKKDPIQNTSQMTYSQITPDENNYGVLIRYKAPISSIMAKNLDIVLLRNLVLKTRGMLFRQFGTNVKNK
jgi:hypothetical protein